MWEHVQQEPLRTLALGRDGRGGTVPLPDEVVQEEIARPRDTENVECEEGDHEPPGNLCGLVRQERIERGREPDHDDEGPEPAAGLPASGEQQRPEGRRERPQDDPAGRHEPAQAELQQERQDQAERELPGPEEAIALRPREAGDVQDRCDLEGEGDGRWPVEAQDRVHEHPDDGESGHDARRQDERLLPQRLLRGVRREDADPSKPGYGCRPACSLQRVHRRR